MQLSLALALCLAASDGGVASLEGTWLLDSARSGALDPLLDRVGAGFLAKAGARSSRPTHVITFGPEAVTIEVRSLRPRKTNVVFDGKTEVQEDFAGHPLRVINTLENGVMVSRGQLALGTTDLPFETRRWLHADGSMRFVIRLAPPGERAIEVERVFTRQ